VTRRVVAAIDIGASGGRVMAGVIEANRVTLDPVHRFQNGVTYIDGHLRWNITSLFEEVLDGLTRLAARYPTVESIGIDTWAVDYGLLDANGALLAEPISYRDQRTAEAVGRVHAQVGEHDLFSVNGLQFLPFNTVYQLAAEQVQPRWDQVAHIVLLPDLFAFWLTGVLRTEYTNATTTGLVDVRTGLWSADLLERLRLRPTMFPPIEQPGTTRGCLLPHIAKRAGMQALTVVTTVGSHDTASAVVGVPARSGHFAYIAIGTWSLVGLELDHPVVTPAVRVANFTNEGGVDGRTRFLRNVGGLWLLQESMRMWAESGTPHDLHALLADAAALPSGGPTFDVDDDIFIPPDDMPNRIAAAVVAAGRSAPASPAETVRCVLDSLAAGFARTIRQATDITGRRVDVIHIVGGGSQNELLCQLTADSTRVPVIAGPVEATALGNVLVQARAIGAVSGTLEILRTMVAESTELRSYEPCRTP
jgi:rhamnulokinase